MTNVEFLETNGTGDRIWFASHGLAFELCTWKDTYGAWNTELYLNGCAAASGYNYEDADLAVFDDPTPSYLIYVWPHAPIELDDNVVFVNDLLESTYALEGIVLTYAGSWVEKLDEYKTLKGAA